MLKEVTTHYIYALVCPSTGAVRYLGRTTNPVQRQYFHRNGHGTQPVEQWKRRLKAQGKTPVFVIVETLVDAKNSKAKLREYRWIRYFRKRNQPLLNRQIPEHN